MHHKTILMKFIMLCTLATNSFAQSEEGADQADAYFKTAGAQQAGPIKALKKCVIIAGKAFCWLFGDNILRELAEDNPPVVTGCDVCHDQAFRDARNSDSQPFETAYCARMRQNDCLRCPDLERRPRCRAND